MSPSKTELLHKQKIKKSAFSLFALKGYSKTTTREIASNAGIKRGHLYYYYEKKEYLLADIYNDYLHHFLAFWVLNYHKNTNESSFPCVNAAVMFKIFFEHFNFLDDEVISSDILISAIIQKHIDMMKENKTGAVVDEDAINARFMAHTMAYGAGSHLLYAKKNGIIDISFHDIAIKSSELYWRQNNMNETIIKEVLNKAVINIEAFDIDKFMEYLSQHCDWYTEPLKDTE